MKVFALGGPQGNTGQKSVLVKKPVSRKFIVLSSLEILVFFYWQPIAYTFIINNVFIYLFYFCDIYVWENTLVYMSWLRMYYYCL